MGRLATNFAEKFRLNKGGRVFVFTSNIYEAIVAALACARIGCIHYLLNSATPAKDVATQIDAFKPQLIFTTSHIYDSDSGIALPTKNMIALIDKSIKDTETWSKMRFIYVSNTDRKNEVPDEWTNYSDLITAKTRISECVPLSPQDPLLLVLSSGTTGKPKYLVRSHLASIAGSVTLRDSYNIKLGDTISCLTQFGYSMYY